VILRISFLAMLLAGGAWSGGWAGFFACFLLAGLIGFLIGPPQAAGAAQRPGERDPDPERVQARRGRQSGAETTDEYLGMLTAFIEREQRDPTRPTERIS